MGLTGLATDITTLYVFLLPIMPVSMLMNDQARSIPIPREHVHHKRIPHH